MTWRQFQWLCDRWTVGGGHRKYIINTIFTMFTMLVSMLTLLFAMNSTAKAEEYLTCEPNFMAINSIVRDISLRSTCQPHCGASGKSSGYIREPCLCFMQIHSRCFSFSLSVVNFPTSHNFSNIFFFVQSWGQLGWNGIFYGSCHPMPSYATLVDQPLPPTPPSQSVYPIVCKNKKYQIFPKFLPFHPPNTFHTVPWYNAGSLVICVCTIDYRFENENKFKVFSVITFILFLRIMIWRHKNTECLWKLNVFSVASKMIVLQYVL